MLRIERILGRLPDSPCEAANELRSENDLESLIVEARREGMLALLAHYLPEEFSFAECERHAMEFRAAMTCRIASDIVCGLRAAGIGAVVLKGPAAAMWYPHVWMRPASDVDVLVTEEDAGHAIEILKSHGYGVVIDDRNDCSGFHQHVVLLGRQRVPVELHYKAAWKYQARFDAKGLLSRATPVEVLGQQMWVLSAADSVVYQAVHLMQHALLGVKWLYDLKVLIQHASLDWNEVIVRAREADVERIVGFALRQSNERVNGTVPGWVLDSLSGGDAFERSMRLAASVPAEFGRQYWMALAAARIASRRWWQEIVTRPVQRLARIAGVGARNERK